MLAAELVILDNLSALARLSCENDVESWLLGAGLETVREDRSLSPPQWEKRERPRNLKA